MMRLTDDDRAQFRSAVLDAARRHEVRAAVHNVYRAVQDQLELRRPKCDASGRCCRFDEFGHRLFVTTMELSTFLDDLGRTATGEVQRGGCPFQVSELCSVHTIRPFGCRIFFCDGTSVDWQRRQYEFFHAELKRLHGRLGVPYFYIEWRDALAACGDGLSVGETSF